METRAGALEILESLMVNMLTERERLLESPQRDPGQSSARHSYVCESWVTRRTRYRDNSPSHCLRYALGVLYVCLKEYLKSKEINNVNIRNYTLKIRVIEKSSSDAKNNRFWFHKETIQSKVL